MADVFRRGRKDVHRAIVSGDPDDPMRPNGCNLDGGGEWGPLLPPGTRCHVCFAALTRQRRSGGRGKTPLVASAAVLALVAAVFGSSLGEPVNILGPFPSDSAGPSVLPSMTPAPSVIPSSEAPVLTPNPTIPLSTLLPQPTFPPLPTFGQIPTYPPVPTWPPLPVLPPLPTLAPTLPPIGRVCVHPGTHLGVDPCKWPHN